MMALAGMPPATADGIGYEDAPPQEICGLCHGLDGVSLMSKFPRLAGQKAGYIEKQLHDFREGRRGNDGGQMAAIVTEITEEQIGQVARYFSSLPPPSPFASNAGDTVSEAAKHLFHHGDEARGIPACASCHLPGTASETVDAPAHAPYLTAQHADYIAKQLHDFRDDQRENDGSGKMATIAKALTETEIGSLAAYLASMPRKTAHAN